MNIGVKFNDTIMHDFAVSCHQYITCPRKKSLSRCLFNDFTHFAYSQMFEKEDCFINLKMFQHICHSHEFFLRSTISLELDQNPLSLQLQHLINYVRPCKVKKCLRIILVLRLPSSSTNLLFFYFPFHNRNVFLKNDITLFVANFCLGSVV